MNFIASQALARSQQRPAENADGEEEAYGSETSDAMVALERQARAPQGFVPASSGPEGGNMAQHAKPAVAENPDALDVDLGDE